MGAKIAEAKQSDLVPTEVVQPENNYWLVRATEDLPPGEYALMLGTQNMSIFAFTIANPPNENPASAPRNCSAFWALSIRNTTADVLLLCA
jgi:hypothetical protein